MYLLDTANFKEQWNGKMSDYGWFALKGIGYLVLVGFVIWITKSLAPLFALLLFPSWDGTAENDD